MFVHARKVFSLVLLLVSCVGYMIGQSTGTIRGAVADSTGAAIPQTTVTATNTATDLARNQQTNDSGIYVSPICRLAAICFWLPSPISA